MKRLIFTIIILIIALSNISFTFKDQNKIESWTNKDNLPTFVTPESIYKNEENNSSAHRIYESKEELFEHFFKDFYDYIIDNLNGKLYLEYNGIYSLQDFYNIAKKYEENELQNMPWIGDLTGIFFAKKDTVENIFNHRSKDGFIGHCIENKKYIPQITFFIDWFATLRKDEGLLPQHPHANDFLYNPHDTIIDICKFFYWDENTLPVFLKSKGYIEKYYNKIPDVIMDKKLN